MNGDDVIVMGKIVGVHGVQGNVKVYSYAEDPSVFLSESGIHVAGTRNGRRADDRIEGRTYKIRWMKPHRRVLLFSLEGVDSREAAEALVGAEISVPRSALPALPAGEYYWFDIIGLDVYAADDAYLGRVTSIMPTGSNDVYVVHDADRETLVPALQTVILEIDLENNRMQVDLPEGL